MRIWADIFTNTDVIIGTGITLTSASSTRALDGAGSFTLTFPAASESLFNLAQLERKVRIYVEQDEQPRFFGGGIIRELAVDESSGGAKVVISGPDSLDALTRKSVLLRRKYNLEQPSNIASDLISLVPPWSITVAESNYFTSARFDGISVLKALLSIAEKAGLHIREGETPNTLEMGAFGEDSGIKAVKPDTLTVELNSRDDILLIEKISQKSSSRDVINWIIPLGAGEGDAATTLEGCVNVTPETMIGPDGTLLYFIRDVDSIATFGQNEKIVTFKDVVPIINSDQSKARVAELLFTAATAWLERNAQPLVVYNLNVKKVRTAIRPGDKIRVAYQGIIETDGGSHTYLDVNELFWVMKTTEQASDSGLSMQMEIATVDRQDRDGVQQVVEGLEAIDVRNVSPQTHVVWITKDKTDVIWGSTPGGALDTHERIATFYLDIDDGVTDIREIKLHFKSERAYTTAGVTTSVTWDGDLFAFYSRAPNFPATINLAINGIDVTSEFGGPWGSVGASTGDIEIDITDKIRAAIGGMYREHTFEFSCANASGERSYDPHTTSSGNGQSGGMIRCEIKARLVVKD
jgi:hypothetical protein